DTAEAVGAERQIKDTKGGEAGSPSRLHQGGIQHCVSKPQKRFGAKRQIKDTKGGEARIAEPPASRQNTALLDRHCQSGLERSDKKGRRWTFNLLTNSYSLKNPCANLPSAKSFPT